MRTPDLVEALLAASAGFRDRLMAIPDDGWSSPSVCEGWSVKDVNDHVVGGNRFAVGLLDGKTAHDALTAAFKGGFDQQATDLFDPSAAAQQAAFAQAGALGRRVDHPAGVIDGDEFLRLRIGDLVLHGWDLARSTGGDETLDSMLTPMLVELYRRRATTNTTAGDGPDDADPGRCLLLLSGRKP